MISMNVTHLLARNCVFAVRPADHQLPLRLEKPTGERKIELKEEQFRLLERFSSELRERHIEAPHTGILEGLSTPSLSVFVGTTGII